MQWLNWFLQDQGFGNNYLQRQGDMGMAMGNPATAPT